MRPIEVDFTPGPRGWVAALGHWFSPKTRERAIDYIDDVTVEIDERSGVVHAQAYGTRLVPYEVALALEAEPPRAACSCPVGESRTPCKHMLAVLYALDLGGVTPARAGRMNLAIVDREDRELIPVGPLDIVGQAQDRQALLETRRPSWRDRIIPAAATRRGTTKPVAIEYVVRAQPVRGRRVRYEPAPDRERLAILIAVITGPKAGPVRRRFWLESGRTLDPVDAERIAALTSVQVLASTFSHYYGTSGQVYEPTAQQAIWLAPDRVDEVVASLAATGRLGWLPAGEQDPSPLTKLAYDGEGPWSLAMTMTPGASGVLARGALMRGDQRIAIEDIEAVAGAGVVISGGAIRRTTIDEVGRWLHLLTGGLDVPEADVPELLATACVDAAPVLELDAIGWRSRDVALAPRVILALRKGAAGFDARAELRYDDIVATEPVAVAIEPARREVVRRDLSAEEAAVRRLRAIGGRVDRSWTVAAGRVRAFIEAAAAGGWEVLLDGNRVRTGSLVPRVKTGIDWFDVSIGASDGDAVIRAPELLAALRYDRPYVKLSDGTAVVIPPWLEARSRVFAAATASGDAFRFAAADALVVSSVVAASPDAAVDDRFAALRARLDRARTIGPRVSPPGFVGTLRDYQAQGLGWLEFLRELGLGGCLADDMGLGKTVQILALLAGAPPDGAARKPSLVVAPRSLVFHWLDEARRFAPALRTLEWHGGGRDALAAELPRADLVVTTYATLRRDITRFSEQAFATVILDEAQAIKNATSQTAAACRRLRADHRLALTGTPIENRLDDLASIFDFLDPGLLGQPGILRAVAAGETDIDQARAIGRVLRPVMLRRTKDEVLTELPAKTEVVVGCRLDGIERRRYDEIRGHYRDALLKRIERDGVAKSALVVLEALLRLRQAALHPGLLDPALAGEDSAKLDALVEHLRDVIGSGHRALVFSQFTTLLAIVRKRLDREGIRHEYLDGQTRDRRERVAAFQAGTAAVFLLSLKAGGTGLNLTAADHVFLLDPWWNPAVEAQAIDRVHRIGQSRPVTAYRLVAEDTVEAKILALQEHKRALFTGVFEDKGVVGRLTVDDIRALLD
jgi:superfamily II DNA or RNA helicase